MNPAHYHLVGIAGTGMNPLAQMLHLQGCRVSGSDRYLDSGERLPILDQLERMGITLAPQDGSALTAETAGIIVSTAIEADNPELARAKALNIPILHRAEMLARLVEGKQVIAIAGTSGKTTTTGMTGYLLEQAGLDPNVVNGGVIVNWASRDCIGNVRKGDSDLWVIETDESDRSLLNFHPDSAVITSMTADHFPLGETIELFRQFSAQVHAEIVCGPNVREHLATATKALLLDATATYAPYPFGYHFHYAGSDFRVHLPGQHNALDAHLAIMLCELQGVDPASLVEALTRFKGIERRLQKVGDGAVKVYDEYAHNPEKIEAAWTAVAGSARHIIGCWKPHGYGPLAAMAEDLAHMWHRSCRPNDRLYILPVYYAGGTTSRAMESETFVEQLQARGIPAFYAPDYDHFEREAKAHTSDGDAVLIMGARDPELPACAHRLGEQLA
ncbi:MAG: UDP-N-acetylmuramate--alanine ligase [Kiritimatiellia bacterium]|jgi:UDP-N-acetylmuramate--alanine ligase